MAIGSKRGLRSILSRKTSSPYAHLKGDENDAGTIQETKEPPVIKQKPVMVNVDDSIDARPELECVNGVDRIIICTNTDTSKEDEKESEDDVYTATRKAAIAIVRDASLMTDLVAKRMALASTRSFTSVLNSPTDIRSVNGNNFGEEKTETEEVPTGESNVAETNVAETNAAQAAMKCGNELVETSKEKVGTALQQTQNKANDLLEASISSGKDFMSLTETGSQAAIVERLPLSPLLEQASDRMEAVVVQVVDEVQEFLLDHWTMLQDFIAARKQMKSESSVDNVNAENPTPCTSIEVQVQATITAE